MEKTLSHQIKNFNDFISVCNYFDIEINNNQLDLFKKYYKMLLEWNERINLISRNTISNLQTSNDLILEKHFLDSILFLPELEKLTNNQTKVLDIGSGGGFPGIPLAIMKMGWDFTLCESIRKKANFLIELVKSLGLEKNVKVINDRVETINKQKEYKNAFNLVSARAVAKLDELMGYSMPLLKRDGYLIAYKAKDLEDEIKNIKNVILRRSGSADISQIIKIFSKEINSAERKLVILSNPCIF